MVMISSLDSLKQLKVLMLPVHFNNRFENRDPGVDLSKDQKVSQTCEPSVEFDLLSIDRFTLLIRHIIVWI